MLATIGNFTVFKRVNIDCGNKWNKVADLVKVDEFQKTLASVQLVDLLESAQRIQMDYVHYLNKLVQFVEHSIKLRQLNWKNIHKLDELVQLLTMARFPKNFACEENTQT